MISKRKYYIKYLTIIGIILIILSILVNSPLKEVEVIPEQNKKVLKESVTTKPTTMSLRDSIVDFGDNYLETPYVYGSCSKDGFDCSGFVYFVFQHYKITLPRSSSEYEKFGKEVPIESVKKGDILVFLSPTRDAIGHLGIVTNPKGKNSDFIHASSSKEMKVMISSLNQEGYTRRFVKAIDVLEK